MPGKSPDQLTNELTSEITAHQAAADGAATREVAEAIIDARTCAADAEKKIAPAEAHLTATYDSWRKADDDLKNSDVTHYDLHGNTPTVTPDEKARNEGKRLELTAKAQNRFTVYTTARTTHDAAAKHLETALHRLATLERDAGIPPAPKAL
ncbi:MAG: hypothetical protein ABUJ98_10640 [Hyphomicrobium sp.]